MSREEIQSLMTRAKRSLRTTRNLLDDGDHDFSMSRACTGHDHQREAGLRRVEETMMPKTDSIEELAAFWQRHDVTDFEDELEEVPGPVFRRTHVIAVPLTGDEHRAVRDAAASRGIDEVALIHEWIKQRLHHA